MLPDISGTRTRILRDGRARFIVSAELLEFVVVVCL